MSQEQRRRTDLDPQEVRSRRDLSRFLDQSLLPQYVTVEGPDEFAQASTFVKSYIVESHQDRRASLRGDISPLLSKSSRLEDETLILAFDRKDNAYFIDTLDERFVVIHTIANASDSDYVIGRVVDDESSRFDRSWMPTELLMRTFRGTWTGFKFGSEQAIQGLVQDKDHPQLSRLPKAMRPGKFRMSVTENWSAASDYENIRASNVFAGKQALEQVQFVVVNDDADAGYISNRVYSDGKIVGSGTSINAHLVTVQSVLSLYANVISQIEERAIGWESFSNGFVHHGEPFLIAFPDSIQIDDLRAFAHSIVRPAKPFRLMGIPHRASDERIDAEIMDMHTGDSASIEITKQWMRVYLPSGACGNIIARLYTNLQHVFHSDITLSTANGQLVFQE